MGRAGRAGHQGVAEGPTWVLCAASVSRLDSFGADGLSSQVIYLAWVKLCLLPILPIPSNHSLTHPPIFTKPPGTPQPLLSMNALLPGLILPKVFLATQLLPDCGVTVRCHATAYIMQANTMLSAAAAAAGQQDNNLTVATGHTLIAAFHLATPALFIRAATIQHGTRFLVEPTPNIHHATHWLHQHQLLGVPFAGYMLPEVWSMAMVFSTS